MFNWNLKIIYPQQSIYVSEMYNISRVTLANILCDQHFGLVGQGLHPQSSAGRRAPRKLPWWRSWWLQPSPKPPLLWVISTENCSSPCFQGGGATAHSLLNCAARFRNVLQGLGRGAVRPEAAPRPLSPAWCRAVSPAPSQALGQHQRPGCVPRAQGPSAQLSCALRHLRSLRRGSRRQHRTPQTLLACYPPNGMPSHSFHSEEYVKAR